MSEVDLSELRVFIVDDDRHMLTLVSTVLDALKISKIEKFDGAKEALDALKVRRPDLVITDWNMSPITGIDFLRQIRNGHDVLQPDVPVLMLTAFAEMDKILEAREVGIAGFLKKPISAKMLYDHIVKAVEHPGSKPSDHNKT